MQEVASDGMGWIDQKTQPIQDKLKEAIDYGSKTFNKGIDTVSQTTGKVTDNISSAVSGVFNDKPSQTPYQAPKPTEIKLVQITTQNERSKNEDGTPKVVVFAGSLFWMPRIDT